MFALLAVIAGITGTVFMSLVMWFIDERNGPTRYDPRDRKHGDAALRERPPPRNYPHVLAGGVFAVPYLLIMRAIGVTNWWVIAQIGLAIGTFHGAAMVFILMALSEKHPVEQFRTAGPAVGWAHVIGHMAYGAGVGLAVGVIGPRIGELTKTLPLP